MAWFIDDLDQYQIYITDTVREYYIPKFRIQMDVVEPNLFLRWNDRERGDGGDVRLLTIDYRDVVDGYSGYVDNPTSAASLRTSIEAMIVSGWTSISAGGGDLLTAKADLLSHDGVSDTILTGGTNEYILSRDNNEATGLKWISKAAVVAGLVPTSSYVINSTGTVSSTNTASEELLWGCTIPGGTLATNDVIEVKALGRKTSGVGSNTFRVRIHSASGTGGTLHSSCVGTSTQSYVVGPFIFITGANSQIGTPAFNNATYAVGGVDTAANTLAIASDIFINITNQKVTGTDGFELRAASVIIHKYRS